MDFSATRTQYVGKSSKRHCRQKHTPWQGVCATAPLAQSAVEQESHT